MQVKTFKANDMSAALRMVKTEFGTEAMILSSRLEKRRGLLGCFSRPYYEITAAHDRAPAVISAPLPEKETGEANALAEFRKSMLAPLARELKELRTRVEQLTPRVADREPLKEAPKQALKEPFMSERRPDLPTFDRQLRAFQHTESVLVPRSLPCSEVEELKKVLLRSVVKKDKARPEENSAAPEQARSKARQAVLELLADDLRVSGVGEQETRTLMAPVAAAAARGESEVGLRKILKDSISASINCALSLKPKKGVPRILAMVGPTGVGKTTTIAKLAANAYKHGFKIAIITIDTFRIGAVAQLQTYSGIMGLPLEVASTPQQLAQILAAHSDKQMIFIDTAGRTPRDREKLLEMKSFLDVNPAIEVHLCLSATTRDTELGKTVARFGVLPVSRVLFTKLDESESFGSIINVHLRAKLPLSYFTTGQKVPEDIETATSAKLADLIVREIKP